MKYLQKISITIIHLLLLLLVACHSSGSSGGESARFSAFLDQEFVNSVANDAIMLNYTLKYPEAYGIDESAVGLMDYSPEAIIAQVREEKELYNRLLAFNRAALTHKQQLEYDALVGIASMQLDEEFALYDNYFISILSELPVLLAEYRFDNKQDIDIYIKLLKDIPRMCNSIEQLLRAQSAAGLFMPDYAADDAINQLSDFITQPMQDNILVLSFDQRLAELAWLSAGERQQYSSQNLAAINSSVLPAYSNLIAVLTSLKGTGVNEQGVVYFPNGKRYYEQLVRLQTGMSESIEEIEAMIDEAYTTGLDMVDDLMNKYPDIDMYDRLNDLDYGESDPQIILTELQSKIQQDFPPLTKVISRIKYVLEALEAYMAPAFYLIPPVDDDTENAIYINKSLISNEIYTVIAHEGYPGHLYQYNYAKDNASPLRIFLEPAGYVEGWATYVELLSYDRFVPYRQNPDYTEFMKLDRRYGLALMAKMDIGINYKGWTLAQTNIEMANLGFSDEMIIQATYEMLTQEPGYSLTYFASYLR